jgi:cellulose synthase/poly-beta-1,6-N-acetylglucosamine synthase-like glycosyltransferase
LPGLAIILVSLSLILATVALVLIVRILRADREVPRVRDGDRMPPATGLLSIVIPAHNEARVIAESVRGLRRQTRRNFEAIYVLDRCTDQTRELLVAAAEGDPRVRFIENAHCPDDWAGKCNACRVGAREAKGEWLLFTDADCRFAPDMLDAMLAIAQSRDTALLSALGRLTFQHRFERLLQPVAAAVLLRIFPLDKANREHRRWPFANGQFLLFRREAYEAFGGHELVKNDLLEDLAFARAIHASGGRLGVVDATRRMEVAMYESAKAMRAGWTRIYIESCGRRPKRLVFAAVELCIVSVALPLAALGAVVLGTVGAFGGRDGSVLVAAAGLIALALGFATVALLHQRQRAPLLGAFAHPFAAVQVVRWLFDGSRMLRHRVPVRWGGREYVLEPR